MTTTLVLLVLDVDLRTAILLGAVASSTDAAAVFAVLRTLPVRGRLRSTVEAESGFNDPPVIILVTVVASESFGGMSAEPSTRCELVIGPSSQAGPRKRGRCSGRVGVARSRAARSSR